MARMHPPKAGGLAKWQRQRAMELLGENLNGNVRLGDLAKECGLSVSHFARSFKAVFGVSSHQWLIRKRIDLTKELLTKTTLPLSEIAVQSGFGDQAAFTRTFHRIAGASPVQWRRAHQAKYLQVYLLSTARRRGMARDDSTAEKILNAALHLFHEFVHHGT